MQKLFTYGTLQDKEIQEDLFGRALNGSSEQLIGYQLSEILIEEEFGIVAYPIIKETQNPNDIINGIVYHVSQNELYQTDLYEGKHYKRVKVKLQSDELVWAYSLAN